MRSGVMCTHWIHADTHAHIYARAHSAITCEYLLATRRNVSADAADDAGMACEANGAARGGEGRGGEGRGGKGRGA
jgi:hypothetical protein